jgi:hypothetical protein
MQIDSKTKTENFSDEEELVRVVAEDNEVAFGG